MARCKQPNPFDLTRELGQGIENAFITNHITISGTRDAL